MRKHAADEAAHAADEAARKAALRVVERWNAEGAPLPTIRCATTPEHDGLSGECERIHHGAARGTLR